MNSRRFIIGVLPKPNGNTINRGDRYEILGYSRWETASSVLINGTSSFSVKNPISRIRSSASFASNSSLLASSKQRLYCGTNISGGSSLNTSLKNRCYVGSSFNSVSHLDISVFSKVFAGTNIECVSSIDITNSFYKLYSGANISCVSYVSLDSFNVTNFNKIYMYFPSNIQRVILSSANI